MNTCFFRDVPVDIFVKNYLYIVDIQKAIDSDYVKILFQRKSTSHGENNQVKPKIQTIFTLVLPRRYARSVDRHKQIIRAKPNNNDRYFHWDTTNWQDFTIHSFILALYYIYCPLPLAEAENNYARMGEDREKNINIDAEMIRALNYLIVSDSFLINYWNNVEKYLISLRDQVSTLTHEYLDGYRIFFSAILEVEDITVPYDVITLVYDVIRQNIQRQVISFDMFSYLIRKQHVTEDYVRYLIVTQENC
jgi:hypothetical protein